MRSNRKLLEAYDAHKKALELNSNHAEAWNALGIVCRERGNRDEATQAHKKALEINPEYAEAHNNLGIICDDNGELEVPLQTIRRPLRVDMITPKLTIILE